MLQVSYIHRKFNDYVFEIFNFFRNSSKRYAQLREIQLEGDGKVVRLKEPKDTRWLSRDIAVTKLRKCFSSVLDALQLLAGPASAAADRAKPAGLYKQLTAFNFCACLLMMSDVLPLISALSRNFQDPSLTFDQVPTLVGATVSAIAVACDQPQDDEERYSFFQTLPNFLEELRQRGHDVCDDDDYDAKLEEFTRTIKGPFLAALRDNINARFPSNSLLNALSTIFCPAAYPAVLGDIEGHGVDALRTVIAHYCKRNEAADESDDDNDDDDAERDDEDEKDAPIRDAEEDTSFQLTALGLRGEFAAFKRHVFGVRELDKESQRQRLKRDGVPDAKVEGQLESLSVRAVLQAVVSNEVLQRSTPHFCFLAAAVSVIITNTGECERGFSTMNRIKTADRSVLLSPTLNDLMRISLEQAGPSYDVTAAVKVWAGVKPRRANISFQKRAAAAAEAVVDLDTAMRESRE